VNLMGRAGDARQAKHRRQRQGQRESCELEGHAHAVAALFVFLFCEYEGGLAINKGSACRTSLISLNLLLRRNFLDQN
jgi:hypothetical protein